MKINHSFYETAKSILESSSIEYFYKKPTELTDEEFQQIANLVSSGGEVMQSSIKNGLKAARLVGFAKSGDTVVATASVKNPSEFYKDETFWNAGVERLSRKYKFEYGYTFTHPDFRSKGIVKIITSELMKRIDKPMYATMREKNSIIIKTLEGLGMKRIGNPYPSSRGNYNLIIMGN